MNTLLYAVFQDNPLLSNEIYKFCNGVPDYVRAEREYLQIARQVADRLGYDLCRLIRRTAGRGSPGIRALAAGIDGLFRFGLRLRFRLRFGLGLRRELAAGLMLEE